MNLTKKLPLLLFSLLLSMALFAQDKKGPDKEASADDAKFEKAIGQTLAMLETAETPEAWQKAANTFDRISKVEADKWLVHYYKAYSNTILSFMTEDKQLVDQMLDGVDETLKMLNEMQPDNSEIHVLMALAKSARIQVDPMSRGMIYGPQSTQLLNKALELDEDNPRAYYLLGQNLVYTPEAFGGGKEAGCNMLAMSKEKYGSFELASPIMPNWGEDQVDQVMGMLCKEDSPSPEELMQQSQEQEQEKE